jgi:hypothetical protein
VSTVTQRPVLDVATGNINIQATEGIDKGFQRGIQDPDTLEWTFRDISADTYTFEVNGPNGVISVPCVNGGTVYEKRIQVSPEDLADLVIGTSYPYSLVDSSSVVPISRLEGKIKLRGFRT